MFLMSSLRSEARTGAKPIKAVRLLFLLMATTKEAASTTRVGIWVRFCFLHRDPSLSVPAHQDPDLRPWVFDLGGPAPVDPTHRAC